MEKLSKEPIYLLNKQGQCSIELRKEEQEGRKIMIANLAIPIMEAIMSDWKIKD